MEALLFTRWFVQVYLDSSAYSLGAHDECFEGSVGIAQEDRYNRKYKY
jgi:hypothetical protein